jgi:hypothetical protein
MNTVVRNGAVSVVVLVVAAVLLSVVEDVEEDWSDLSAMFLGCRCLDPAVEDV